MEPALALTVALSGVLVVDLVVGLVRDLVQHSGRLPIGGPLIRRISGVACAAVILLAPIRSDAGATTPPPSVRMITPPAPSPEPVALIQTESSASIAAAEYTVVRGDCLWRIAKQWLLDRGHEPDGRRITELWKAIYERNRDVIGDDPNLILPGQLLTIPTV